jgi:hypothetical protein
MWGLDLESTARHVGMATRSSKPHVFIDLPAMWAWEWQWWQLNLL